MSAGRETAVGCLYCRTLTANADKVCNGPACRTVHGHPIYVPNPSVVFPRTPGRRIVRVEVGR